MSKFSIFTKKLAMESVRQMYIAILPICNTEEMVDAMEAVDNAALAIYAAHDMTFDRCAKCDEDGLVELVVGNLCENCAGDKGDS